MGEVSTCSCTLHKVTVCRNKFQHSCLELAVAPQQVVVGKIVSVPHRFFFRFFSSHLATCVMTDRSIQHIERQVQKTHTEH